MARDDLPPRKRCRGNRRPAPFLLTPAIVRGVIELAQRPRVIAVPVLPIKLVDRPRRSEDPRLACANDKARAPETEAALRALADAAQAKLRALASNDEHHTLGNPTADRAGGCEGRAPEGTSGAGDCGHGAPANARQPHTPAEGLIGSRPGDGETPRRGIPADNPEPVNALSKGHETPFTRPEEAAFRPAPATRADRLYSQRRQAEARELEAPVDRRALIREAAQRLARRPVAQGEAIKARPGMAPASAQPIAIPPLPSAARAARFAAAVAFLKARAILVTVVDRNALVRRYRVSGKLDSMFAEDVIARAVKLGFNPERSDG